MLSKTKDKTDLQQVDNYRISFLNNDILIVSIYFAVLCLFGGMLYLSPNKNINDPNISPFFSILKDLLLLVLFVVLISKVNIARLASSFTGKCAAILCSTIAILTLYVVVETGSLSISYVKIMKNLFLYGVLPLVLATANYRSKTKFNLFKILFWTLNLSFILSIGLYYLHSIQSIDLRLYGTYGNPTSAGLAAILSICISLSLFLNRQIKFYQFFISLLIAGQIVVNTASFSVVLMLLGIIPTMIVLLLLNNRIFAKNYIEFKPTLKAGAWLILVTLISFGGTQIPEKHILSQRLNSLIGNYNMGSLKNTESVTVRKKAFSDLVGKERLNLKPLLLGTPDSTYYRFDATLVSYIFHFGVIGLVLLLSPLLILLSIYFKNLIFKTKIQANAYEFTSLQTFVALVLILNITTQHQYEVFPLNFYIFFSTGLLLCMLRPSKQKA